MAKQQADLTIDWQPTTIHSTVTYRYQGNGIRAAAGADHLGGNGWWTVKKPGCEQTFGDSPDLLTAMWTAEQEIAND